MYTMTESQKMNDIICECLIRFIDQIRSLLQLLFSLSLSLLFCSRLTTYKTTNREFHVLWLTVFLGFPMRSHHRRNYLRGHKPTYSMEFLDLPPEILPEIFSHIVMPHHLASLCLVNNTFQTFAVCELYKEVSWHKEETTKACVILALPWAASYHVDNLVSQSLTLFFNTLSCYPYLALLVYRIGKPL